MFLLIPYKQLTIKTPLSMQKAEERLAENVGKIRWRWSTSNAPFNGTVENGRFNIIRATNYRHTFQPAIIGQFHGAQDMTRIEINMRLYSQAILLLGFFLSMLVYNGIRYSASPI